MKRLLSKTLLALAIVSFTSIVMAECDPCCPPPKPQCEPCKACEICPPCDPCEPCCTEVPKIGEPCNCAYNGPARIDPACGWDAWLSASFLYWQPKEKGLELGLYTLSSGTEEDHVQNTYRDPIKMDFDYHPAFKLGVGFSSDRDDWTLFLEYTRFYSKDRKSKSIPSSGTEGRVETLDTNWINSLIAIAVFFVTENPFSYFSNSWKVKLNIFDLEVGRPCYLGKKLIFKPHYGLRGGSIDQKYKSKARSYSSSDRNMFVDAYSSNKLDSWLIGPRAGVDTDWLIGCDFRIFGNLAGSLFYQKMKTKIKSSLPPQKIAEEEIIGVVVKAKNYMSYLTPNVEFELGLGYGTYFCNNEWYFDLTAGYSFNYFWNQNTLAHQSTYINSTASRGRDGDAGDLMLHGLTITARLDF